ncbi:hypothetical protein FCM35_KLT20679 [Carex littledalei]|uniref:Ubiquitin-like protease family profile domain-containing protein n=1 Tax=Carex littledalei TaxID=544730 RepID=A0A833QW39_9POAL|nr:hypothetical protein FCM35_KLT20679 [Carex littledalei]
MINFCKQLQGEGEQITAQLEAEGQQTSLPEDVVKTSGDDTNNMTRQVNLQSKQHSWMKVLRRYLKVLMKVLRRSLKGWFFEHVKIPNNRKFTGHIPRFLDHKLNVCWRRSSLNKVLDNVLVGDIDTSELKWEPAVVLNKEKGFVASDQLSVLSRNVQLRKPKNSHLLKLMTEMAPVYCLFNFKISTELVHRAAKHRFEDLKYIQDSTGIPLLSPASEQKLLAEASHSERQYHISKRLFRSPVKAIEGAEKANSGEEQDKKTKSVVAKVEGKVPSEAVGQKKGGVTTRSSSKLLIKSANVQDNVPPVEKKAVAKISSSRQSAEIKETPASPLNKRVLFGDTVTPTPSVGRDPPMKKKKNEIEVPQAGEENLVSEEDTHGFTTQEDESQDPKIDQIIQDVIAQHKKKKESEGGQEGDEKQGIEKEEIVGKDVEVCNLGDMDGPSFSLGLSPEVQIPAEDKTKEVEKVDVETNQLKSRSKVMGAKFVYERVQGRRRGRKSIPETETNVIEISSQEPEQQKPKRQKVIVVRRRKRVPMRRTMPKRGVNEPKPPFRGTPFIHDLAKIDVPFIDWLPCTIAEYGDENLEFDEVPFKLNYPDWDFFSDSIFVDPTFESCTGKVPLPDKNWCYEHRDLVSVEVSNVLDSWVKKYFQFEVGEEDYPFKNNPSGLFMTIDQFRDLLFSNNEIGSEAVDIALLIMQQETPVDEEWFYLKNDSIEMAPFNKLDTVYRGQRELFSPQFEKSRWLFVPLVGLKHWILVAFDLKNQKIEMYNSLHHSTNTYYFETHINHLHWVKYFLSWRLGKPEWMDVQVSWMETPQQSSQDCAIFVLRCIDCLTRKVPLNFTQEMISAERLLLACRILTDERNEFKFAI